MPPSIRPAQAGQDRHVGQVDPQRGGPQGPMCCRFQDDPGSQDMNSSAMFRPNQTRYTIYTLHSTNRGLHLRTLGCSANPVRCSPPGSPLPPLFSTHLKRQATATPNKNTRHTLPTQSRSSPHLENIPPRPTTSRFFPPQAATVKGGLAPMMDSDSSARRAPSKALSKALV